MDASRGSLEPIKGSKLPVKVGKDITADEGHVLALLFRDMFSRMIDIVFLCNTTNGKKRVN